MDSMTKIRVFKNCHNSSEDGWDNDAYYGLVHAGIDVKVPPVTSWEEVSDHLRGEEFMALEVDESYLAQRVLSYDGFRVELE